MQGIEGKSALCDISRLPVLAEGTVLTAVCLFVWYPDNSKCYQWIFM